MARTIEKYEEALQGGYSQRQIAEELEVPRSTLQYWLSRRR
ncbi:MAG: helix-turn-helix domain-containing protein [Anaerolineae bacterium]|nr:helix-turn-helix domain-containing protein [Anaerolineae bacterium]